MNYKSRRLRIIAVVLDIGLNELIAKLVDLVVSCFYGVKNPNPAPALFLQRKPKCMLKN